MSIKVPFETTLEVRDSCLCLHAQRAARALARRAYRTIQENLFVGVGVVHVLGITAALLGWIGPVQAAMLHLGPDILVFLNSVKLLRVRVGVISEDTRWCREKERSRPRRPWKRRRARSSPSRMRRERTVGTWW